MKKLLIAALAVLLSCGVAFALTHSKKNQSQFTNTNAPIFVKASNPEVTVKLPANRSTGFMWLLMNYSKDNVEPVSSKYITSTSRRMGAMGTSEWLFRLKPEAFRVPQITRVVLVYAQPWRLPQASPVTISFVTEANGAVLKKQASLRPRQKA